MGLRVCRQEVFVSECAATPHLSTAGSACASNAGNSSGGSRAEWGGSGERIVPAFLASPPRKWEILGVEHERGSRPEPSLQMSRLMMWSDILSPELDNLFGAPEELFCRIAGQVTR